MIVGFRATLLGLSCTPLNRTLEEFTSRVCGLSLYVDLYCGYRALRTDERA